MDDQQLKLKERLLEMAKTESVKFGEDIGKTMKENIELNKNLSEKWVKITFLKGTSGSMSFNKENFDKFLVQFTEDGTPAAYEMVKEKDFLLFKFKDEELVTKVYNYYQYFFFGGFQQERVNTLLNQYIEDLICDGCSSGTCNVHGSSEGTNEDSALNSLKGRIAELSKGVQGKIEQKDKE